MYLFRFIVVQGRTPHHITLFVIAMRRTMAELLKNICNAIKLLVRTYSLFNGNYMKYLLNIWVNPFL